jgi:hypothetical protein
MNEVDRVRETINENRKFIDVLADVRSWPDGNVNAALRDGLRQSYAALGDRAPKTIDDLYQNDARGDVAQLTGAYRDYLNQRMMAVSGLLQLSAMQDLSPALRKDLHDELTRLAVLFVATERYADSVDALAAK